MKATRRGFITKTTVGVSALVTGCATSSQSNGGETTNNTTNISDRSTTRTNDYESTSVAVPPSTDQTDSGNSTKPTGTFSAEMTDSEQLSNTQTQLETANMGNVGQVPGASWSTKENPQTTGHIGTQSRLEEGDRPHLIQIWNDASSTRTIFFSLVPIDNPSKSVFENEYQLKPDSYAQMKLMRYNDYLVRIGVDDGDINSVAKVPSDLVDCNQSSTYIAVRDNGRVEWSYFTTDEGCKTLS